MAKQKGGTANALMQYSFLVAFANDGTLDQDEVAFLKQLTLEDGIVDKDEVRTLRQIFSRVTKDMVDPDTWADIKQFRKEFGI